MTQEELAAALEDCQQAIDRLRRATDDYARFAAVGEAHEELRQASEEYRAAHRAHEEAVKVVLGADDEGDS